MNIEKYRFTDKKILVIGTIFMDIKGYPFGTFIPHGRNAGRIEYKYGGVARNVAADLAALGLHPYFISISQGQGHGKIITTQLQERGVITDYILETEDGIGTWMAIFNEEGDVYANLSQRQSLLALCELLDRKGEEIFRGADGVLLEMDIEEELVSRVFALAERCGVEVYGVISNMTIAKERLTYIQRTRCFICNRKEAELLFNETTDLLSLQQLKTWLATRIKESGISCMVVTLDKDGSVYADAEGSCGHCPAQQVTIVDSTGAGDSFFAGTAAGLIEGWPLDLACRLGTEMAAEVIGSEENTL